MSATIRDKAFHGVLWSAIELFSSQGLRFVIGIILARLLLPAEFGLIGMLAIFMGLAQVFVNCGFGQALIQKQETTRADESSVFYLNVALGSVAAVGLCLVAPRIAVFYHQPTLVLLTRLMALDIFINSFGVIQTMLLMKKIDFKTQLKVGVVSTVVSGGVAVVMALRGFGVLSLAAQILVGDLLRTLLLWAFHAWRPLPSFSLAALRNMFPYGSRLFASGLLNSAFVEVYSVVIGRLYPPAMLGMYTRARQMQQLPVDNLCNIVGRVSFPVFSSIHQDKVKLKRAVRKASQGLALLNFPIMVGLAVTARPLVVVLLTDKWAACVPFIQLLCVAGAFYPLSLIHVNALSAQGRSDLFLRLEIIKKGLIVLSIIATYRFGVQGLLVGGVVASVLSYLLNGYYSVRLFGYSWREQFLDVLPYAGISALMGWVVWLVGRFAFGGDLLLLLSQVAAGVGAYLFGCWFWQVASFREARDLLGNKFFGWKPAQVSEPV
jgi:O-antigen/teichoic acid export membrane protein